MLYVKNNNPHKLMQVMKSITRVIPIFLLMPLLIVACSEIPGFGGNTVNEIETIKSGHYSNYPNDGKVQKVIDTQSEFNVEWEKVHSGVSPLPETPSVNFDSRTVVLMMLEEKPTGGYSIDEISVVEKESKVVVSYAEVQPGDDCMTTQALTKPYAILSIPNTGKEVRFIEKDPIANNCSE